MPCENTLEQQVKRWAKANGYKRFRLKLNPGRGWPDIVILLPGNICVWIELKTGRGVTSPQQEFIHKELENAGHNVFVCYTLEEVIFAVKAVEDAHRQH